MNLDEMRLDLAKRSKRGLHIIIASVFIWSLVLIIWLLPIKTVEGQNLLTFCALTPLLPFFLYDFKDHIRKRQNFPLRITLSIN